MPRIRVFGKKKYIYELFLNGIVLLTCNLENYKTPLSLTFSHVNFQSCSEIEKLKKKILNLHIKSISIRGVLCNIVGALTDNRLTPPLEIIYTGEI